MAIDLNGYDSNDNFDLIEKGRYPMTVTEWEKKETSAGKDYYSVKFTIFGEKYDNRSVYENFWIGEGFSEKALAISMGKIKGFFETISEGLTYDTYEDMFNAMLDKPVKGYVGISKSKDPQYSDKNCIYSFKPIVEEKGEEFTSDSIPF